MPQSSANSRDSAASRGPFLALEDLGEPVFQGGQPSAPPEQGFHVGAELVIPGEPVEAAAGRDLGFAEPAESQERLAEDCGDSGVQPRVGPEVHPEGLLEVVNRLVQPARVARGEAEVVVGDAELRVDSLELMKVTEPLVQSFAEDDVAGPGGLGVDAEGLPAAVVHLVQPAPARQREAEVVMGPGVLGVDPKGLPAVDDGVVHLAFGPQRLAEVRVGRCEPGVELEGLPVLQDRIRERPPGFQGEAEVVVRRGESGVDPERLVEAFDGRGQVVMIRTKRVRDCYTRRRSPFGP